MPGQGKLWRFKPVRSDIINKIATKLGLSQLLVNILLNRGIDNERDIQQFLHGDIECLEDPLKFKDMEKAIQRIVQAIALKQPIVVYGDYDVDGITATTIVLKTIKKLGGLVDYYIPDRQSEGYGLNSKALVRLAEMGTKLIITVDCGISAVTEIASVSGVIDIIITDHHQPPVILPDAYAIVNPRQPDCNYPYKDLAGVGVAFKLCQALLKKCDCNNDVYEFSDLVAIGTIADIVSLTGENRILVKKGLKRLAETTNPGLTALLNICGLANQCLEAGHIGYLIAPRLNAAGRMDNAALATGLLMASTLTEAMDIAQRLNDLNLERQSIEKSIYQMAEASIYKFRMDKDKVIVVSGKDWHAGIIGIVASKLSDKFYRPIVVVSENGGTAKGSCRSIPGFDIYSALSQCGDLLEQFGGHSQAAGLTICPENICLLKERLNSIADNILTDNLLTPVVNIDSIVALKEINQSLIEELSCIEPYGMGNPMPVFVCNNVNLTDIRTVGNGNRHLKGKIFMEDKYINVIAWGMGSAVSEFKSGFLCDIVFTTAINEWQGTCSIQIQARDIRSAIRPNTIQRYPLDPDLLKRSIVAQVFFALKDLLDCNQVLVLNNALIAAKVNQKYQSYITNRGVLIALDILKELNIITIELRNDNEYIKLLPAPAEKADIYLSATFKNCDLIAEFSYDL